MPEAWAQAFQERNKSDTSTLNIICLVFIGASAGSSNFPLLEIQLLPAL